MNRGRRESDEDLLLRFGATGDRTLFAELFDRHWRTVLLRCRRIVADGAAAEEVTQDTFIRVYKRAKLFQGGSALAWILSIASHLSINRLRSRARELSKPGDVIEMPAPAHAEAAAADLLLQVTAVLRKLTEPQRAVLKLHYFEDYSYEEIAELTGWGVGTVRSHLQNGRRMFAKYWNEGVRRERA